MAWRRRWTSSLLAVLLAGVPRAYADELPGVVDANRARINYMLNCRGCHGPGGEGNAVGGIPRLAGFVGNFLRVPGGRAYLVQVPGSANAALSDAALAELLNWLLPTMGGDTVPATFDPYETEEVGRLRQTPETDVAGTRSALLQALARQGVVKP
jgi:hypothetical protein